MEDRENGTTYLKHNNGRVFIENKYKGYKLHGEQKIYDKNGVLQAVVPHRYGAKQGIKKDYHENGKVEWEVPYENGLMHGSAKRYDEHGDILCERFYRNGKRTEEVLYKNGKIVLQKKEPEHGK